MAPACPTWPGTSLASVAWFESRTDRPADQRFAASEQLRRSIDWAKVELSGTGQAPTQAPRLLSCMMVALELQVCDMQVPTAVRVGSWVRLIKTYAAMRWDDIQRMRPDLVELRESGLAATLVRTKTSGKGKRRMTLPAHVPQEAFLAEPG